MMHRSLVQKLFAKIIQLNLYIYLKKKAKEEIMLEMLELKLQKGNM